MEIKEIPEEVTLDDLFASSVERAGLISPEDRATVALVSVGIKPAGELQKHFQDYSEVASDVTRFKEYLVKAGLVFDEETKDPVGEHGSVMFVFASNKEYLQALKDADATVDGIEKQRKRGKALGYPDTAIEAHIHHKSISIGEYQRLSPGIKPFIPFLPSREHKDEEIADALKQRDLLKALHPTIYKAVFS